MVIYKELVLFSCWKDKRRRAGPSSTFDMDKLKSTIKQFVRDWSEAGKAERDSCYTPIIEQIQKQFPPEKWCVNDFIHDMQTWYMLQYWS